MRDGNLEIDFLSIQWYEANRTVMKRKTEGGRDISLSRLPGEAIHDGEVIYVAEDFIVKARIEPCICIILCTDDISTIGSFCFDVGNRHLPIFDIDGKITVSYDARLFQALSGKYGDQVQIGTEVLDIKHAIKAFGNYL